MHRQWMTRILAAIGIPVWAIAALAAPAAASDDTAVGVLNESPAATWWKPPMPCVAVRAGVLPVGAGFCPETSGALDWHAIEAALQDSDDAADATITRHDSRRLQSNLTAMWTTVLELPKAANPFGGGSGCIDLGGTLAPFAGGPVFSCTVKPGTKLFIAGYSAECSTWEHNGTTDAELRQCAHDTVAAAAPVAPPVTVDGRNLPLEAVDTPLMEDIDLPADNIFDGPAATPGLSVGYGWVALVNPLPPGAHTITDGSTFTTTIVVEPIAVNGGFRRSQDVA